MIGAKAQDLIYITERPPPRFFTMPSDKNFCKSLVARRFATCTRRAYSARIDFLPIAGRTALQCGAEEAKPFYFHIVAIGKSVSQRSTDGLHDAHYHSMRHVLFAADLIHELFPGNSSFGTDTSMKRLLLAVSSRIRCLVKIVISTHNNIIYIKWLDKCATTMKKLPVL